MSTVPSPALRISGLTKHFRRGVLRRKETLPAVDDVDFLVERGEVVGLIGESGSGKTTLMRSAIGLMPFDGGKVEILGTDLTTLSGRDLRRSRKRFQLLFQNPDASLNPGLSVWDALAESASLHRPDEDLVKLVRSTLASVGLAHRERAMPHQLSGGEKRRVGIARLLIADPQLVVADEPTAGLDAALKADLIDLLLSRRDETRGYVLISHDLPLVAYACCRICVMYAGRVVERFPTDRLRSGPHHPYTRSLLAAAGLGERGEKPPGMAAGRVIQGCPFRGACAEVVEACTTTRPSFREIGPGHSVACHVFEDSDP